MILRDGTWSGALPARGGRGAAAALPHVQCHVNKGNQTEGRAKGVRRLPAAPGALPAGGGRPRRAEDVRTAMPLRRAGPVPPSVQRRGGGAGFPLIKDSRKVSLRRSGAADSRGNGCPARTGSGERDKGRPTRA